MFAGWLRYLMGVDDGSNAFTPNSDPLLEEASAYVKDYALSDAPKDLNRLDGLLSNEKIFGVNLVEIGMAETLKFHSLQPRSCRQSGIWTDTVSRDTGKFFHGCSPLISDR